MKNLLLGLIFILGFGLVQAANLSPNIEYNKQLIQALKKNGSNMKKPHPLEHHFYCTSPESLKALMAKGRAMGYRPANLGNKVYEGVHYWYGDLIKETKVSLNVINHENATMLKIASEFKAGYDGWGTPIVK